MKFVRAKLHLKSLAQALGFSTNPIFESHVFALYYVRGTHFPARTRKLRQYPFFKTEDSYFIYLPFSVFRCKALVSGFVEKVTFWALQLPSFGTDIWHFHCREPATKFRKGPLYGQE